MNVRLMFRDRDFVLDEPVSDNSADLVRDLELEVLVEAMARDDASIRDSARTALLASLSDASDLFYRQEILKDCLANPEAIRELHGIAADAIESKRKNWFGIHAVSPGSVLYSGLRMLGMYRPMLERLRRAARLHSSGASSEGLKRFFSMVERDLDDAYLSDMAELMKRLSFEDGVMVSARLGRGAEATDVVLRKPNGRRRGMFRSLFAPMSRSVSFSVHPRDESGCRSLSDFRDRGVNAAADAVAKSADHIEHFFKRLLTETAFFVGCVNLAQSLSALGEPICFPEPAAPRSLRVSFTGLYNPCLSLHRGAPSVGNDADANGKNPIVVTGVNEGGKSTFLRSLGVAQLMMQCGAFVPARSFSADLATGIFTHYRRREDRNMSSGKLDEELARMDAMADSISSGSLVLFNESFASTNEREGSEIAGQIARALVDRGVRVCFVTHLHAFAEAVVAERGNKALFLRAERGTDGARHFKLVEGPPLPKSHGEDVYRKVFAEAADGSS